MHQSGVLGLIAVERTASCALGGAFEAAGCQERWVFRQTSDTSPLRGEPNAIGEPFVLIEAPSEWSVLYVQTECPSCDKRAQVFRLIPHLNDDHRYTREVIASFVEAVECLMQQATTAGVAGAGSGDLERTKETVLS